MAKLGATRIFGTFRFGNMLALLDAHVRGVGREDRALFLVAALTGSIGKMGGNVGTLLAVAPSRVTTAAGTDAAVFTCPMAAPEATAAG